MANQPSSTWQTNAAKYALSIPWACSHSWLTFRVFLTQTTYGLTEYF